MKTQIFESYEDFIKREDKSINGVSKDYAESNPGWNEDRGNSACWNCSDCSNCERCYNCEDCSGCSDYCDCSETE